jgi:shikimate O-hydroxycinnamoyltransferase
LNIKTLLLPKKKKKYPFKMTGNVKETYFARPTKPAPTSPLTDYVSYIYFFKNVNNENKFMDANKMISSLEDILSDYYPLAGRLRVEPEGRMSIVRSDKGVPFVVAESPDITIKQLEEKNWEGSSTPDGLLAINKTMIDSIDAPLFAVKHTTLADGVVLGIVVSHSVTDDNGFLISW